MMAVKKKNIFEDKPYTQDNTQQSIAPNLQSQSKIDTTKDTVIHNSPAGKNETIIYNSGTNTYRIQSRDPGTSNITETDPYTGKTYMGSSDAETRGINARAGINEQQQAAAAKTNLTPEQQAQIGQLDKSVINDATDPLSQDIIRNIQGLTTQNEMLNKPFDMNDPLGSGRAAINAIAGVTISPTVRILNRNRVLPGAGNILLESITKDDNIKSILSGYSNEDNYDKIKGNIDQADKDIAQAMQRAKVDPVNAASLYTLAQSKKYKAIGQLKAISDREPRKYADDAITDMTILMTYFNGEGKKLDDAAMRDVLQGVNGG